jgi:hypothetical protein
MVHLSPPQGLCEYPRSTSPLYYSLLPLRPLPYLFSTPDHPPRESGHAPPSVLAHTSSLVGPLMPPMT